MESYSGRSRKCICFILVVFISVFPVVAHAQDSIPDYKPVPINKFFYRFDKNLVGSFKYHHGLNYVIAGASTVCLIAGNVDWNWYRYTYEHRSIYNAGYNAVYIGWVVPFAVPLGFYVYGHAKENTDLQIIGLAMGQVALVANATIIVLKVFTGRVQPSKLSDTDDLRGDFRFGFLNGGADNGWPSSHTAVAFAMATTLAELCPDNTAVKIGAFTYASLIGVGVSANVHWLSDVVAGGLIGYAIGKTVGTSFRNLLNKTDKPQAFNFSLSPVGVVINYKFD